MAVQVEVTTLAEAQEAVAAGAGFLLCDNMTPEALTEVVPWSATGSSWRRPAT